MSDKIPTKDIMDEIEAIRDDAYPDNDMERHPYRTGVGRGMRRAAGRIERMIRESENCTEQNND